MGLIIGLAGRAGSGKTTAANYIRQHYGAVPASFAFPLKHLAKDLFDLSDRQVFGSQEEKEAVDPRWGKSPREIMQKLGGFGRDAGGENFWVDQAFKKIMNESRPVVIDDVRYHNEGRAILARGGRVIRLVCPDAPHSGDHPSEASVDTFGPSECSVTITSHRSAGSEDLLSKLASVLESPLFRFLIRRGIEAILPAIL